MNKRQLSLILTVILVFMAAGIGFGALGISRNFAILMFAIIAIPTLAFLFTRPK